MDSVDAPIYSPTKFSAAIQITRPRSASIQGCKQLHKSCPSLTFALPSGTSSLTGSPVNQIKVAKLVLKPAQSLSNKSLSPQKRATSAPGSITTLGNIPLQHNNKNKTTDKSRREPLVKKYHQTLELEKKNRKAEGEKKLVNKQPHALSESLPHKSSAMDEAARKETRDFMKRQREKRKLEIKNAVDKSFMIKQRLDELRKTTRRVIVKKPSTGKKQVKISPPKEFYSINSLRMKEIKVLRLKPMSSSSKINIVQVQDDKKLLEKSQDMAKDQLQTSAMKTVNDNSVKSPSPMKVQIPEKKPSNYLQTDNKQNLTRPPSAPKCRPISSSKSRQLTLKENMKPEDDLRLKVPNLKLSMSAVNRMELPSPYESFLKPQPKVPFWLENTAVQPYPYNFIWAVRKKLEAFTSKEDAKRAEREKSRGLMNMETPRVKKVIRNTERKFPDFLSKHFDDDTNHDLQRPIIADHSKANQLGQEEANTISEISSIQSDLVLVKSKSQEKEQKQFDDDDTTISESLFHSVQDDNFVEKKRESINSEPLLKSLAGKEVVELHPSLSPNTSEKRVNFLSSTAISKPIEKANPEDDKAEQNDLDKNKLNQEKEQEYQKMLTAFNQSLSHVIEVNQMLSSALSNKSSVASAVTSETVKNYTSSFENNPESETIKTSNKSNISEMIEDLVQQSQPAPLAPLAVAKSESNSSIKTLLDDSKSNMTKPETNDAIEDPPIVYSEAQEFSSNSTKVTTTMTTKVVQQQRVLIGKKEDHENTLNESKLINMFGQSESETSFNIIDNNASFGMLMEKSSTEIKSWERSLTERTRGQIAWLELQKQNFRKHGQLEKASTIKKQQRAILLRLEKEKSKLRENSEKKQEIEKNEIVAFDESFNLTTNQSEARENIERILQQREEKLAKRRAQVENLIEWQRRLDKEEEKLKQMESDLLCQNMKKSSPRKKKVDKDFLNTSLGMVKSIDKSLKALENIQPSHDDEKVSVSGAKLNKLWKRLTGIDEVLYQPDEVYHLNKQEFAQFYEKAKEVVLQSDLKLLLDTSALPQPSQPEASSIEKPSEKKETEKTDMDSDDHDRTLNSIANIETEEEFPGSLPYDEPETETVTTTENDEDLKQMMANQMKVFIEHKLPIDDDPPVKDISALVKTPTIDNTTFKVSPNLADDLDKSTSTVGVLDMDFEQDSLIQTEPLLSIDNSSVDLNGFIIPEVNQIQVTDMDQDDYNEHDDDANDQLIEDISFPNLELSMSDEVARQSDERRKDLSTISECTEYEQSQGSSDEHISSEIVSHSSTTATTSARVNSEIEQRLISINDSLEEVNEALNKVIINRSPSTMTYSTDKDFVDSAKVTTSESPEKSVRQDLLLFSPIDSKTNTGSSSSQVSTSTPKILVPDILSEVSDSRKEDASEDF